MTAIRGLIIAIGIAAAFALVLAPERTRAGEAEDTAMSKKIVGQHLAAFGAGNIDALLVDFADDIVFISPGGVLRGKAEVRPALEGLLAEFGKPGMTFNMGEQNCAVNFCQIVWSAETADNTYEYGTDTFVIEGGKIVAQTFAAKMTPKKQ